MSKRIKFIGSRFSLRLLDEMLEEAMRYAEDDDIIGTITIGGFVKFIVYESERPGEIAESSC